ncbi:MAG: alpha/beta hydrolase fold domain-containing protein [Wujia sp.]
MGKKTTRKFHKMNYEAIRDMMMNYHKRPVEKIPAHIYREFDIDELKENGQICYRLVPKTNFSGTYIMYLYTSQLCLPMRAIEWEFITRVARECHAGLFVPMYPLAPECGCKEVFQFLEPAYANCTRGQDVERLVLMGTGNGAGFALSLAMSAWREGWRKPDQMYLLSPCMDTEYFDKDLEAEMLEATKSSKWYFYNESVKEFINNYWVKDYAVKTEYTSPFYCDLTDLCDDVIVFSGIQSVYHCYAREFYKKAKKSGLNIRYFEFEDEAEDFLIFDKTKERTKAYGFLIDCLNHTYDSSLRAIYPIKMMSDWTKKYPEHFKDPWASKFIYSNKFDFSKLNTRIGEYDNLRLAASASACDTLVRRFIQEYPFGTVIHLSCRLDNMFGRLDNGRIQWYNVDTHNIMSIRRSIYGVREREKTIGRRMMDFSWMDDIVCKQNQGLMIVCDDGLSYLSKKDVQELFERLWEKFPGAQLVFTASTSAYNLRMNLMRRAYTVLKRRKRRFGISDTERVVGEWRAEYRIMEEYPIMKFLELPNKVKLLTRLRYKYNLMSYNHRVARIILGSEEYKINFR